MTSAFQAGAFQADAFQTQPFLSATAGDFIDYIFKFPDQGSYQRDPVILAVAPPVNGTQPGVQLLIYNPVETLQGNVPTSGNTLVLPPQLANSTVALSGFWAMITLQNLSAALPKALTSHSNIQIINDRTLMFAQKPSVIFTNIDTTHINIIINIFGVYVRDGLQLITNPLLLEDGATGLDIEDGVTGLFLEGTV